MKYLFQFAIICACALAGEVLNRLIPLPVPAMVYGLVVMFALLSLKVIPLAAVEETSMLLISLMAIFLAPMFVALIEIFADLRGVLVPLLVILIVATALTMGITGAVAQVCIGRKGRRR